VDGKDGRWKECITSNALSIRVIYFAVLMDASFKRSRERLSPRQEGVAKGF